MSKEHKSKLRAGTNVTIRPWRHSSLLLLALALALAVSMMALADKDAQAEKTGARSFTQSDTEPQSGFLGNADGAPINDPGNPFTFSKTSKIVSLNRVALVTELRVPEGENLHPNALTLALDGIDTGIRAQVADDGDDSDRNFKLLFSGTPDNADQILAALKDDGELQATLIDNGNNEVRILDRSDTTLAIQGKKEGKRAKG